MKTNYSENNSHKGNTMDAQTFAAIAGTPFLIFYLVWYIKFQIQRHKFERN